MYRKFRKTTGWSRHRLEVCRGDTVHHKMQRLFYTPKGRSPPLSSGNATPEKFNYRRMNRSDWKPGRTLGAATPGGLLNSYAERKSWKNSRSLDRTQPFGETDIPLGHSLYNPASPSGKRTYSSVIPLDNPPLYMNTMQHIYKTNWRGCRKGDWLS